MGTSPCLRLAQAGLVACREPSFPLPESVFIEPGLVVQSSYKQFRN